MYLGEYLSKHTLRLMGIKAKRLAHESMYYPYRNRWIGLLSVLS